MRARLLERALGTAATMFLLFQGCTTIPDYSVSIKNTGNIEFDDANVRYGSFESGGGIIAPGTESLYLFVGHPIPDEAVVEWTRVGEVRYRKKVNVGMVPKNYSGKISFEIDDSNRVTVRMIP